MASGRGPDTGVGRPNRVGVFGGTFDPPHRGHAVVAADVADALALDRVLWIPAGHPPHRLAGSWSPAPIRLEMAQQAACGDERFIVRSDEIDRPGASYTVDTLAALRAEDPSSAFFLIVGVDQFRALDEWHEPERILALANIAVMDRDGASAREASPTCVRGAQRVGPDELAAAGSHGAIVVVPVTRVDVSSTELRGRLQRDEDVTDDLSPAVLEVIRREGLYRDTDRAG